MRRRHPGACAAGRARAQATKTQQREGGKKNGRTTTRPANAVLPLGERWTPRRRLLRFRRIDGRSTFALGGGLDDINLCEWLPRRSTSGKPAALQQNYAICITSFSLRVIFENLKQVQRRSTARNKLNWSSSLHIYPISHRIYVIYLYPYAGLPAV